MTSVASGHLAADLIAAIKAEIIETGRFSLPEVFVASLQRSRGQVQTTAWLDGGEWRW